MVKLVMLVNVVISAFVKQHEHYAVFGAGPFMNVTFPRMQTIICERLLMALPSRAGVTPFLAANLHGYDNFKWMLYGDDDTVFFVDNALDMLEELDHNMPYFLTDHLWFPDQFGEKHTLAPSAMHGHDGMANVVLACEQSPAAHLQGTAVFELKTIVVIATAQSSVTVSSARTLMLLMTACKQQVMHQQSCPVEYIYAASKRAYIDQYQYKALMSTKQVLKTSPRTRY